MRLLLFAGTNHYPSGGIDDYLGDYSTLDKAKDVIAGICAGLEESGQYPGVSELWAQISAFDEDGMTLICRFEGQQWIDDKATPNLQNAASEDSTSSIRIAIADYLVPQGIVTRREEQREADREHDRKRKIEELSKKLITAASNGDFEAVSDYSKQLRKLGVKE